MQITWHGLSCFEVSTKTSVGEVSFVIDPFSASTGLKLTKGLAPELALISHEGGDASATSLLESKPFIVRSPGEYEVKGIFVYAVAIAHGIGFRIETESMRFMHLGALSRALTNAEIEALGSADILCVPVGGGRVLSPETAAEVVAQLEPRVIIPMMYATEGVKESLKPLEEFTRLMGTSARVDVAKYKLAKKDLPEEGTALVVLSV